MNLRNYLCVSVCLALCSMFLVEKVNAQQTRSRVVSTVSSQPVGGPSTNGTPVNRTVLSSPTATQPQIRTNPNQRPVLTNQIIVQPPVQKIVSSQPTTAPKFADSSKPTLANRYLYNSSLSSVMMNSIQTKFGIPYRLGSTGPNRYDCSGFVWSVFNEAGIYFERSTARTYWEQFEPVEGADRFKFGTLVFFNKLGHVGIVADENGFYHASSSKGITYSPFKGYWEKRVVGYRRIPAM